MKILLTAVNARYIHSNLAVYSLKASVPEYDGEIGIAEYTINQTADEILMDVYGRNPDLVCISCYLWNIDYVGVLVHELPKILPGVQIWLGGPEVSYDAEDVLERYPPVKGVMCGEGEETFRELTAYYHGNGSLEEIRGIVYRKEDGTAARTPARPVMDLNRVPFVYRDIENFRNRIVYYESGRGCPFSCSYCLSSIDKCVRFRDMDLVKKELQFFIDRGVPQVKFVDRTFNCRHDHAMAVWTYIKEHDRGITNFHFEVAADLLNQEETELIRSMRPGLIQLEIGVQSVNPETIREIRRVMDPALVKDVVLQLGENRNVHRHLDLIAGLPYEDYDSFAVSFNEVYSMRPDQLQLGFLKVLKGSFMHENAGAYGLVWQDRPPYEVLSTRWLAYSDVVRLKRIEEMTEVYYNSGQFSETMRFLEPFFASPFDMYEKLAEYYEKNGLFRKSHSRIARYEILLHFAEEHLGTDRRKKEEFLGWLTYDLYLRDNVKNRPAFLGESRVGSREAAAFYRAEEEERRYLPSYEGYDRRQMRKMTHLERIGGTLYLFDYRERDALSGGARVCVIPDSPEQAAEKEQRNDKKGTVI